MCSQIIVLSKEGYSIREIAEKVGVLKSCVRYSVQKYDVTGICSHKKSFGRLRKANQGRRSTHCDYQSDK